MNNNLIQIKLKQRLNKLASLDYDNIECWKIQEAFNKAQIEWVRRQIHGGNQYKEGDEQTIRRIDDLQILLKNDPMTVTDHLKYYETDLIPADFMEFKRVSIIGSRDECTNRSFITYLASESDVEVLLADKLRCPDFDWAETFCTIIGNKIRIYTDDKFNIDKCKLTYFRKPVEMQINGCLNLNTGAANTADVLCEFKDDIIELIIDEAASILAGDIESMLQLQRNTQNAERDN